MPSLSLGARFFWNENLEPNILFYKVYVGRSPLLYDLPGSPFNVGNVLEATITIYESGRYYFAVSCVSTLGESPLSDEVSGYFVVPPASILVRRWT